MGQKSEDYMKFIDKSFKQIGKMYSTPKIMTFLADGQTYSKEEHPKTFSSMNFAWKIITELPGKYYVLMNKQQSIRFIRVVKQRILRVLDTNIDFITINLSQHERSAFDKKINKSFIENLTTKINELTKKHNITDKDLYIDNPAIVKRAMVLNHKPGTSPNDEPSSNYKSNIDLQYKEAYLYNIIGSNITGFKVDMDRLDDDDKSKYKEDDTPDILWTISTLKGEYETLFTQRIYMIPESKYDTDISELNKELLKKYKERLDGIRKSANNPKLKRSRNTFTKKNTNNSKNNSSETKR
jgi:hypothetical protein